MTNDSGDIQGYDKFLGGGSKKRNHLYSLNYNQYKNIILGKGLNSEDKNAVAKFILECRCDKKEVGLKYNSIVFPAENFII